MKKSFAHLFLEGTKYQNMPKTDQQEGLDAPPLETPCKGERIPLPNVDLSTYRMAFADAASQRRSVRRFADAPISTKELSYLLTMTQGVQNASEKHTLRFVPSAGARHAFDTYAFVQRVDGLKPGLYRYLALEHALVLLETEDALFARLERACLGQKMVSQAPLTMVWVADIYRMAYRYGERGMRYMHLDAGHVCQNLYLAAETINAGTCAVAAFDDDAMNALLKLDDKTHFTIYLAPVGKKQKA